MLLVEVEPKLIKFKLRENVTKNFLRITANPLAQLQTLIKHLQRFKKIQVKVGGVAVTRYIQCPNMTKFELRKK